MRKHAKLFISLLAIFITSTIATYVNDTVSPYGNLTNGNVLWNAIMRDCKTFPTMSCIQKNVYHFLDDTLESPGNVDLGDYIRFKPNKVDYTKYTRETNAKQDNIDEQRSYLPLEEVTNALTNKGVKFLMTHDLEVNLPIIKGSTLKVSPRNFDGDGVLVKLDMLQSEEIEEGREKEKGIQARIFVKQITKFLFSMY